eukprot:scaffold1501_cov352-Pavlova_lutheri.AAC.46
MHRGPSRGKEGCDVRLGRGGSTSEGGCEARGTRNVATKTRVVVNVEAMSNETRTAPCNRRGSTALVGAWIGRPCAWRHGRPSKTGQASLEGGEPRPSRTRWTLQSLPLECNPRRWDVNATGTHCPLQPRPFHTPSKGRKAWIARGTRELTTRRSTPST